MREKERKKERWREEGGRESRAEGKKNRFGLWSSDRDTAPEPELLVSIKALLRLY